VDTFGYRGTEDVGEETPPSMRLELTTPAREDLLDVWAYIAGHDETAADNYLEELRRRALELIKHPELGRKRDEVIPGIRSLLFRNHLIFYRVEASAIKVLRILHGNMDLKRADYPR
jgi:toxin ParE1/3/4